MDAQALTTILDEIRAKLPEACAIAAAHPDGEKSMHRQRYQVADPMTEEQIVATEQMIGSPLPADYRAFLLTVARTAPGPTYRLIPMPSNDPELLSSHGFAESVGISNSYQRWLVRERNQVYPRQWNRARMEAMEEDSPSLTSLAGLLPIEDHMGGLWTGLIVTGKHVGRVVYADPQTGIFAPEFVWEETFVEWYLRWLDDVVSGRCEPFANDGYTYCVPAGSVEDLLDGFAAVDDPVRRNGYLWAINNAFPRRKRRRPETPFPPEVVAFFQEVATTSDLSNKDLAMYLLEQKEERLARFG